MEISQHRAEPIKTLINAPNVGMPARLRKMVTGDCKTCGLRTPSTSASEEDDTDEDDESELGGEADDDGRIESADVGTINYSVGDVDSWDEEDVDCGDFDDDFEDEGVNSVDDKE